MKFELWGKDRIYMFDVSAMYCLHASAIEVEANDCYLWGFQ